MSKYHQVQDNEWVKPVRYPPEKYKFACCDCGLVHSIKFRLTKSQCGHGKVIQFSAERNNRATGQMRRWMKKAKS